LLQAISQNCNVTIQCGLRAENQLVVEV